jgi:membrane AbrB-like protein
MPDLPSGRLVLRWLATLALGALGAAIARLIGTPLPYMLGAFAAVGIAAASGVRAAAGGVAFPPKLRLVFIPVIGVLIGASLTRETVAAIPDWWPGLLAVVLFVAITHAMNFVLFHHVAGLSRPTAYFAGMPGGLVESIQLGSENGADERAITVLQFARIALTVTVVPLVYSIAEGHPVGSAAGMGRSASTIEATDALMLAGAAIAGFFGARLVHLPAGQILGPVLASGAIHALGWTSAVPPGWLVALAQLVIGVSLGMRFTGIAPGILGRYLMISALSVAAMLGIGAAISAAIDAAGVAPFEVMFLALSPGGVVEMGLIALSLNASPIFVTAHHIVRIFATVLMGVAIWRRLSRA